MDPIDWKKGDLVHTNFEGINVVERVTDIDGCSAPVIDRGFLHPNICRRPTVEEAKRWFANERHCGHLVDDTDYTTGRLDARWIRCITPGHIESLCLHCLHLCAEGESCNCSTSDGEAEVAGKWQPKVGEEFVSEKPALCGIPIRGFTPSLPDCKGQLHKVLREADGNGYLVAECHHSRESTGLPVFHVDWCHPASRIVAETKLEGPKDERRYVARTECPEDEKSRRSELVPPANQEEAQPTRGACPRIIEANPNDDRSKAEELFLERRRGNLQILIKIKW